MNALYFVSVTLHVLAAIVWLGGIFFFALVGAPVVRKVESAEVKRALFHEMGIRFRVVGWISVMTLLATGAFNLHWLGLLSAEALGSGAFWTTPYGRALGEKLAAVILMLALSAWHDFSLGPRSLRLEPDSDEAVRLRRKAAWVARVTGVVGLVVVIAAVRLARGG